MYRLVRHMIGDRFWHANILEEFGTLCCHAAAIGFDGVVCGSNATVADSFVTGIGIIV